MSTHVIILTVIGLAALGMAWMPTVSRAIKISYSVLYLLLGMLLYIFFGDLLPLPNPISKNEFTVHITELVVIISLMGSGLKIDRPFTLKGWSVPLRLVSITMVLTIAAVAFIAVQFFGFSLPAAILLGAVLAPTDPVLASDVQVGPPHEGEEGNVQFGLTAEAGMNDGTAFPFTWLAILLAAAPGGGEIGYWFSYYLLYKLAAGALIGFLLGRLVAILLFKLPEHHQALKIRDGFVAISATLLVYGTAEMAQGYGFIAVFVAAITIRNYEIDHKYHRTLHDFTDQVERVLIAIVLILFGGSLVSGVLQVLDWKMVVFAIGFVLVIRPLASILGLIGTRVGWKERGALSFFGIRGMGSFYYLSFALNEQYFSVGEELWAIGSFVVLLSIIVHGITAAPVLERLEQAPKS